jgi:DtxR family Mn-dependent transcriptional regulator
MSLTAIQEDYLEAIYRLTDDDAVIDGVRATDIAEFLGCRLPTVTRTVRKMAAQGYLAHEVRGPIRLTASGRRTAEDLAHRHRDTRTFLIRILGLSEEQAEADACQVEHGLSPIAAQRLHEFLIYVDSLDQKTRAALSGFAERASKSASDFAHLPSGRTAGWRG